MAIAADLNRVGKRPRSSSDAQATTPGKRRHVDDEVTKQTPAALPSRSRRSATSLRSRRSLPISSPIARPNGSEVYDAPESPKGSEKNKSSPVKPRAAKKSPEKKVVKRKLNRKADKTSTVNKAFDPRRQSTFNPLLAPGVKLSTIDSPVRNTRARRQSPLQQLDTSYVRIVPLDVESGREASPELGGHDQLEIPFASGQERQDQDEIGSNNENEQEQHPDEPSESDHDNVADTEQRRRTGRRKPTAQADNIGASGKIVQEMPHQRVTDQDRNYIMRTYDKPAKSNSPVSKKRNASPKAQRLASQASPKSSIQKQKPPRTKPASRREQVEEDEVLALSEAEAQAETAKRKGRRKMSEEEKRAKAEEKARIREENAKETEAAEIEDFEANGKKFVTGIEDLVAEVGGVDVWFKMGAGAKMITAMPAVPKKDMMHEARADFLWKKLSALRNIFSGEEDASEKRIDHLIASLQAKSTWQVLTRDEPIREDDTTIIDLYKQIIPLSVYVLKEQLKGRFVAVHSIMWLELRSLLEITISLCEIAAGWDPKPTALETGIRGHVRQNIRPNLTIIHNVVKDTVTALEYKEKTDREHAAFTKRQAMKREEKRRIWERINQRCAALQSPQPEHNLSNHTASQRAGVENLELTFNQHVPKPVSNPSRRVTPPPPLRRRPTEEIPAPDPNTNWSDKENVALLNGLQKYLGSDRYAKILKDSKFAGALRGKDVEQCMDRAVFFQAGCSQILKEKADAGDSSFDWLRSV